MRIKKRGQAAWWQLFVLSIAQVGLLAMVILSFMPAQPLANLGCLIKKVFIGPEAKFLWILLPILAMVLMRRKRKSED